MLNCSSSNLFSQTSHFIMKGSLYGFSKSALKRSIWHSSFRLVKLAGGLERFPVQCYSTRRKPTTGRMPKARSQPPIQDETNAFYFVRKGDMVGIFNTLSDCQSQVGSVTDPAVSVYKGYSLPKEAEDYLISHGLKNPCYAISAAHVKEDLFGTLVPCPFKQPDSVSFSVSKVLKEDSAEEGLSESESEKDELPHASQLSCFLEFDGASKGNPGKAGAGAILRSEYGNSVWRLREGLGRATCNVAEYRALILGLKYALKKGFKKILVQGDSKLVYMQLQGLWRAKKQNLSDLRDEAWQLKRQFQSFKINHVHREFNSEADAEANLAVNLGEGEVKESEGKSQ